MADRKISDLTALTTPATGDLLPIVDVSEVAAADKNKKITVQELFKGVPDGTAAAPGLAFESDDGNGIYLAGTDTVAISTGGTQRLSVNASGLVTIAGDLQVEGSTTTIESTTITIDDKNIELGSVDTPTDTTADGGGITLKGATDKTINWVNSTDAWTSSERFDFPAGTAAAPSVILNGDVNSGLYQPGADQVAISTGGTGRLFVDANGRVGIGTATPGHELDLIGTSTRAFRIRSNSSASRGFEFWNNSATDEAYISNYYGGPIIFQTNNDEKVRIDSGGRVGVGTSSPGVKFDVASDGTSYPSPSGSTVLRITGAASSACSLQIDGGNGSAANIYFGDTDAVARGSITYRNSDDSLAFSSSGSEALRITSSGNVGVGTTSPTLGVLDVRSTSTATPYGFDVARFNNVDPANSSNATTFISIGTAYTDDHEGVVRIGAERAGSGNSAHLVFHTSDSASASSEKVRIDSSGRVGIGTSSPSTTLHVDGIATVDRIINSTTSADPWLKGVNGSGTETSFIKQSGEAYVTTLGIGTTSPGSFNASANNLVVGTGSGNEGITIYGGSDSQSRIDFKDSADTTETGILYYAHSSDAMIVHTAGTERARIDSSGRLLVGTTSESAGVAASFQGSSSSASGPGIVSIKTGTTNPTNGNVLGYLQFRDAASQNGAQIIGVCDGNWATGDAPTRLVFSVTADGQSSPTERFRIASGGQLGIGGANYGTSGQVLTSNGSSSAPSWQDAGGSGGAFAYVSTSGTTRTNHFNVSSITQPQTGYYTINFTSAASSSNVTVVASTLGNYGVKTFFVTNGSTTSCGCIPAIATNGAGTNANFCLAVFD